MDEVWRRRRTTIRRRMEKGWGSRIYEE